MRKDTLTIAYSSIVSQLGRHPDHNGRKPGSYEQRTDSRR
jgi:hypothetical protein